MSHLSRDDLYSLEEYSQIRPEFRAKVMEHKKNRRLQIGENATLYFEDALTMKYQIQEMLRIEKIFESEGITEELDAYNPLIPDGHNWKATFMMEYPDIEERKAALAQLVGIGLLVAPDARLERIADFVVLLLIRLPRLGSDMRPLRRHFLDAVDQRMPTPLGSCKVLRATRALLE